jgi:hypothetical protein
VNLILLPNECVILSLEIALLIPPANMLILRLKFQLSSLKVKIWYTVNLTKVKMAKKKSIRQADFWPVFLKRHFANLGAPKRYILSMKVGKVLFPFPQNPKSNAQADFQDFSVQNTETENLKSYFL